MNVFEKIIKKLEEHVEYCEMCHKKISKFGNWVSL